MGDDAAGLYERLSRSKKTAAEANRAAQAAYRQRQKARGVGVRLIVTALAQSDGIVPCDARSYMCNAMQQIRLAS